VARSNRSPIYLIVAGVLVIVLVACIGIAAAIGIPSFIGYVRRSKTSEAETQLSEIRSRLEAYRTDFGRYPADLPQNPSGPPGPERRMWESRREWEELGVSPYGPVYYVYEVDTSDDGMSYVIRARGDLDGDGVESLFELSSESPSVTRHDELE
jgi:type II secretory pathway pseudopilin PulG